MEMNIHVYFWQF